MDDLFGLLLKVFFAGQISLFTQEKLQKAVELLYTDPAEANRILDTIGARQRPRYGQEILSAAVFYYKGIASDLLGRDRDAVFYLDIVEEIPSWYVIYGRATLEDIKEEARQLKNGILKT